MVSIEERSISPDALCNILYLLVNWIFLVEYASTMACYFCVDSEGVCLGVYRRMIM